MIRVVAIGDVMGKAGRKCLAKLLPLVRERFEPDIVIANGENVAGGFGITKKIFHQLTENFGIDCVMTGNHWADKKEVYDFLPHTRNLLVPVNMMNVDSDEMGYRILETSKGVRYAAVNLIGKAFMHPGNRNAFEAAQRVFEKIPDSVKIRIVDLHAEATSEKQAMAHFLSRRASLVYGTHSHVPTADERIIDDHTGFVTDIGMTGAYDSVIGVIKEASLARFLGIEGKKFEPAEGDPWLCFIVADIDPKSGRCTKIERVRWRVADTLPSGQTGTPTA